MPSEFPVILFDNSDSWDDWLAEHHSTAAGLWLQIAKKASRIKSVSYFDAVTVALCYGWIDGQLKKYDSDTFIQRFTPRKSGSQWSLINKERAILLIDVGKMKPAGFTAIERAKINGNWDKAYEPQRLITIPDDFQRELNNYPTAQTFFHNLDSRNRYAILHRIQNTRNELKRKEKIEQYIEMLLDKKKIY